MEGGIRNYKGQWMVFWNLSLSSPKVGFAGDGFTGEGLTGDEWLGFGDSGV